MHYDFFLLLVCFWDVGVLYSLGVVLLVFMMGPWDSSSPWSGLDFSWFTFRGSLMKALMMASYVSYRHGFDLFAFFGYFRPMWAIILNWIYLLCLVTLGDRELHGLDMGGPWP